jgi:hypothetical protein
MGDGEKRMMGRQGDRGMGRRNNNKQETVI